MREFPRRSPSLWDGAVILAVIVLAGTSMLAWGRGAVEEKLTAVVTIDGQEADRFSPQSLSGHPRTYSGNGYTLRVEYGVDYELTPRRSAGWTGLAVTQADCPTQDCVHTGVIYRSGQSIVCLPARIIIRLEGGGADSAGVDAVIG